jgi:hypothetical protein
MKDNEPKDIVYECLKASRLISNQYAVRRTLDEVLPDRMNGTISEHLAYVELLRASGFHPIDNEGSDDKMQKAFVSVPDLKSMKDEVLSAQGSALRSKMLRLLKDGYFDSSKS